MKIKLLIILLFAMVSMPLFSQKQIDIPYDFPVKPGMPEWADFKTGQEMVDACQIPEPILSLLSTKALVETCLNYPLKYDYIVYNGVRQGISNVIHSFNGFTALSEREDAAIELIQAYKDIPVLTKLSKNHAIDENLIKIEFIELLIADDLFFDKFQKRDRMNLKSVLLEKYVEKTDMPELYGLNNVQKTLLLGARILEKTDDGNFPVADKASISKFIKEFDRADPRLIESTSKMICK